MSQDESNPKQLWLEPQCCADPTEGRKWCEHDIFECDEGVQAARYVRADLMPEWQPIETAPKNDSFLVWMPKAIHGSNVQAMRRHPNVTIVAGHFLFDFPDNQPTHWRPLLDGPLPDLPSRPV